jgi:PAS domain S-box-containing protein
MLKMGDVVAGARRGTEMLQSRLFAKILSAMILAIAVLSAAIWFVSVPLVQRKAYEIELGASRTILDNVYEMAAEMAGSLEERRDITLRSFEDQVREAVTLAAGLIEDVFARRDRGEISPETARILAFETLRTLKYGNDDYIWVSDYASNILSHPDPRYHGRNVAAVKDETGDAIIPKIVEIARAHGEGTWTYDWTRLGSGKPTKKVAYFKDLPKYGLVVGSGAYRDDIDAEVEKRRVVAIDEMRKALSAIRIARTGYAYVFDSGNRMIIHPDPGLEGTEFTLRPDPATGKPIAEELRAVADGDEPLYYKWDKPSDPGNYVYDKISWVRHFPAFDWYIASSVYVDELKSSSEALGRRILLVAAAIMALAGLIGGIGAWRIVQPLRRLAGTAARVTAGDLEARTDIRRADEIGVLATAFDTMVARLRDNVGRLEERVSSRTRELETVNAALREAVVAEQRSQLAVKEVEARQRLILDALPAAIAYLDRDERFRFVNRAWSEIVGRPKEAIVGEPLAPIIGRAAYAAIAEPLARTRAGEIASLEYAFTGRDGRRVVTANTVIPQIDAAGATIGCFVLTRDVTDEKETERRIFEAEHLKAIGQLSGGLAHDFNNLLAVIIGNLAAAREKYGAVEGLAAHLEPAERAGRRGADLTSRLLSFARRQPMRAEAVEIGALLDETATLLRRSLPPTVDLEVDREAGECWAIVDPTQLERAVINLVLNARDALRDGGEGGRIVLACRASADFDRAGFDEPVPDGDWVEISVRDTGPGFSSEAAARAFEPFFTTKTLGSGLGLAMVYGFAKQSKGYIRIVSAPGEGATVTLVLAAATAGNADAVALGAAESDALFTGEMALVVEDDDDVRRVTIEQMIGLGFSVIEASDGEEALSLVEGLAGIGVVVSDVAMPGIGGWDLARRLRAAHPDLAVVLVTGFSREPPGEGLEDIPVVAKPWEKADLVEALTRALAPKRRGERDNRREAGE